MWGQKVENRVAKMVEEKVDTSPRVEPQAKVVEGRVMSPKRPKTAEKLSTPTRIARVVGWPERPIANIFGENVKLSQNMRRKKSEHGKKVPRVERDPKDSDRGTRGVERTREQLSANPCSHTFPQISLR